MADTINFSQNGYAGEVLEDLLTYTVKVTTPSKKG